MGDSITKGERASSPSLRWTTLLSEKERWKEVNYGQSGEFMDSTGTPSIQNRYKDLIEKKTSNDKYLFIAYGTNDANFNDGIKNIQSFKKDYNKVVSYAEAKEWPDSSIIIIGGYYITNFTPYKFKSDSARYQQYIKASKEISALHHTRFITLDSIMRVNGAEQLLSVDHVHPNDKGYAVIAKAIEKLFK